MTMPASDEELSTRQAALHAEATRVLAELDLAAIVAGTGPMLFTGSYVSRLMCWPELDVMVYAGAGFTPHDVLAPAGWSTTDTPRHKMLTGRTDR